MAGYSKELLVNVFVDRFIQHNCTTEQVEAMEAMANRFYDEVGRDKFRVYAQVTPEAIRAYNANL